MRRVLAMDTANAMKNAARGGKNQKLNIKWVAGRTDLRYNVNRDDRIGVVFSRPRRQFRTLDVYRCTVCGAPDG